jgi:hypothetical protein
MVMIRADQHAVPLPVAGSCRLDEQQRLALVKVGRKPSEHPLGDEGRVAGEDLENPLIVERFMAMRGDAQQTVVRSASQPERTFEPVRVVALRPFVHEARCLGRCYSIRLG